MRYFTDRKTEPRQRMSAGFPRKATLPGLLLRAAKWHATGRLLLAVVFTCIFLAAGCAQIRLPRIDPTGNRIFLPPQFSTELLTPGTVNAQNNPLRIGAPPAVQSFPNLNTQSGAILPNGPVGTGIPTINGVPVLTQPGQTLPRIGPPPTLAPSLPRSNVPITPAFTHPADPPPCNGIQCSTSNHGSRHLVPHPGPARTPGERGRILLTPSRIVAPVGSEVVVLAGICGGDGFYVKNQPLEWMLSNDSVGQFIEVGGTSGPHKTISRLLPPNAKKFDGNYAWGRTGLKDILLNRGTPTPADDIQLLSGQTFVSVSSASPGTSYVTSVAPKATAWDKRRQSTIIHWVDGIWSIPTPSSSTAGTVHPLTTRVNRSTNGDGMEGWDVRYTIVGGAPAEFAPTGSNTATAKTDTSGEATVQIRQPAGQFEPGTTQVRVDVIRPPLFGEPALQVESGITTVTWSAPALTIRAISPQQAETNEPFNYRIEVTNPGDQVARGVVVRTSDFGANADFISSTPKPTEFGNRYEWELGDIPPNAPPVPIDIQLKSESRGNVNMCFEVASEADGLTTEACAQTEISPKCIGLEMNGPETANVGDEVDYEIVIANQCDEPLRNVELMINYDPGLDATGLGNPIRFPIPELRFGEPQKIPLTFRVLQPGRQCFNLSVTEDGGASNRLNRCVDAAIAANSSVMLNLEGQQRTAVGQTSRVRGTILNNGNSVLENVILTAGYPDSLQAIGRTEDIVQGWVGRDMAFQIGQLNPGEEAIVEIEFIGVSPDGDAFTEMTVTSVTGDVSDSKRIPIRIEPDAGPIGIPGGDLPGGDPRGNPNPVDPVNPGQPGIPNNGGAAVGDLRIEVRALNQNVPVGELAEFEFVVINDRPTADQNVNVTLLVPQSLEYFDFDSSRGQLPIVGQAGTELYLQERIEMLPGEQLPFRIRFRTLQPGSATFEVQGVSRNTDGTAFGRDSVAVQQ